MSAPLQDLKDRAQAAVAPVPTGAQAYESVRPQFEAGDLLCFRGNGPISLLIRFFTKSRYSHVGLVFRYEDHVYCLEAVGRGVSLLIMSELVGRYNGGIDYFEIKDATDAQRTGALGFSFQQLGKRYNRAGIIRFLWFLVFGDKEKTRADGSFFCSELVEEAYRRQGLSLVAQSPSYTSPQDLAASPHVRFLFSVKS